MISSLECLLLNAFLHLGSLLLAYRYSRSLQLATCLRVSVAAISNTVAEDYQPTEVMKGSGAAEF